jgi:putative ABC transport system permease protein
MNTFRAHTERVLNRFPKGVPLTLRMMVADCSRSVITVAGVGACVGLMLFLTGLLEGMRTEANGYVEHVAADLWVVQKGARNMIRSSSFVREEFGGALEQVQGVTTTASLLRVISTIEIDAEEATIVLFGLGFSTGLGIPEVVEGGPSVRSGEILVDRAFARRRSLAVGDIVRIGDVALVVAGFTRGTNAVVAQFAFVSLEDSQRITGLEGVVSYFLVQLEPGVDADAVSSQITGSHPSLSAFTGKTFARQNLEELQTGVIPLLSTIAFLGSLLGALLLILVLYGSVTQRRVDFAVLKAIGAGQSYVQRLIARQALITVVPGFFAGLVFYYLLGPVLNFVVPEAVLATNASYLAAIFLGSLTAGFISALIPARLLSGVYPAEVFRA